VICIQISKTVLEDVLMRRPRSGNELTIIYYFSDMLTKFPLCRNPYLYLGPPRLPLGQACSTQSTDIIPGLSPVCHGLISY